MGDGAWGTEWDPCLHEPPFVCDLRRTPVAGTGKPRDERGESAPDRVSHPSQSQSCYPTRTVPETPYPLGRPVGRPNTPFRSVFGIFGTENGCPGLLVFSRGPRRREPLSPDPRLSFPGPVPPGRADPKTNVYLFTLIIRSPTRSLPHECFPESPVLRLLKERHSSEPRTPLCRSGPSPGTSTGPRGRPDRDRPVEAASPPLPATGGGGKGPSPRSGPGVDGNVP